MKEYLLIIREPDGRSEPVSEAFAQQHRHRWQEWLSGLAARQQLVAGRPLTMNGAQIASNGTVLPGIHKNGQEIVGGFMLIRAEDLDTAIAIARTCPSLEANGPVEVRELM